MGEDLITSLSIENHLPSTLLSMDSSSVSHEELDREMNRTIILSRPPDINLPLSAERSPPPPSWNLDPFDILDVSLGPQNNEYDTSLNLPKGGRKCTKRLDSVWGAWFFFTYYFKPVLNDKSKCKIVWDSNGVSGFDKSDLELEVFLVQHDMENMYMWVFKERPENALGRDLNFSVPPEASEFCSWRNLPNTEFELERPLPPLKTTPHPHSKKLLNGSGLNLSTRPSNHTNGNGMDLSPVCNKRKKDLFLHGNDEDCCLLMNQHNERIQDTEMHPIELPWLNDFSGVMRNVYGPVTGAKTIYEDEQGYLIIVSLPFADLKRVKVTWWNNLTHGVVKISSVSTACMPFIKRNDRTFKLTDPSPEHCPSGEFIREIPLPTRIPDDAKLEAHGDETGTGLEIIVPKHRVGPEEHEVPVCLRPHLAVSELLLS
ncbi:hypothetical protein GH714_004392 [Hevea brasiliensis]|uniref:SHSP domain-containing protein n=1 Tax=Hevea brasiliensis TaxID=3981 RepID=A0A6A6NC54_HEVBR|nr:hypothetical protein GH714_004392 [Hevea brasiliensis]